jgi:cytochrome c peroxidase
MLYFEPRLSASQQISCNSCHMLDKFGVDNEPTSPGHKGQRGGRNSPTVYNAAGHTAQFWDGRAATVEDQAKGPILNPIEMAMPDAATVLKTLKSIPGYEPLFKAAFPDDKDPITYDNLAKAIGAFERQLTTPSRWDKYLAGDEGALTDLEKAGFAKFAQLGCPTCHNGANVGGHLYQKLGLVKPWPDDSDLGRYEVTKNDSDKMFFRVPSLRNIDKTGPYFHKGQLSTLEETVRKMAWHQLGQELKDQDVAQLVAFLKALTGEVPAEYIAKPELPPSGPTTPKPVL